MRGSVFTISGYNVIGFTVLLHERENAIDASVQPHILTAYSHDTLGAGMAAHVVSTGDLGLARAALYLGMRLVA